MRRFSVVGLGENSVDFVYHLPHRAAFDGTADKLPILSSEVRPGGQVATTLAACARFGLRTAYVGSFGNDRNGRLIRRELVRRHVDIRHASVRRAANRTAIILVEQRSGDRMVLVERDPKLVLKLHEVRAARRAIAAADCLHVDAVDPDASLAAVRLAADTATITTCDVDHNSAGARRLVRAVDIPILAEPVAAEMSGERTVERALRALRRPRHLAVCVTLGADGCALLEGDRIVRVPAPRVTAVDTTGAGDIFRAAFIYGWLHGWRGHRLAAFANAAGALGCTRRGAIAGVPSLGAVRRLAATIPAR